MVFVLLKTIVQIIRYANYPPHRFLCGISHALSTPAKFISLFVHEREVLVTWFLFAFSEPWRLDSSQRFFIVYCTAAISLLSRWVLENLFGISYLFLGDFRFQGKDKSFHIFTGSLRALTFQFCCGSFRDSNPPDLMSCLPLSRFLPKFSRFIIKFWKLGENC